MKNIKSNIADGEYIKKLVGEKEDSNKANKSSNEKTILLFSFYYDDIEVVNAIGASRTKHKLGNSRFKNDWLKLKTFKAKMTNF